MRLIFKFLLCTLFLCEYTSGLCQTVHEQVYISDFDKFTEGNIVADIVIPDSKDFKINIQSIDDNRKETVFTIPLISGNKLYPLNVTSGTRHELKIEFDLRYNFCKVFIDGKCLTSILAKKQYQFINSLSTECPECNYRELTISGLRAGGSLFEKVEPVKVVVFGNSTTAYRRTITGVYSQRMPEYFKEKNIPVQVFNEGIGGSHTGFITDNSIHKIRHARDRFEDVVLGRDPDFVSFNFGLNDSWVDSKKPDDPSRIPLNKFRENLLFMINALKGKDIKVIIMTPNAFGDNYESWMHKRTEKYVKEIRKIAKKEKLPLIDQWKLMNEMAKQPGKKVEDFLLPDEMHTNDLWHQILAGTVSEIIINLLNDPESHKSVKK